VICDFFFFWLFLLPCASRCDTSLKVPSPPATPFSLSKVGVYSLDVCLSLSPIFPLDAKRCPKTFSSRAIRYVLFIPISFLVIFASRLPANAFSFLLYAPDLYFWRPFIFFPLFSPDFIGFKALKPPKSLLPPKFLPLAPAPGSCSFLFPFVHCSARP